MFATFGLDQYFNGSRWQIGFRNSNCKSFAVGITAGTYVFVCSNLAFSGEYVEFRKHTAGLSMEELERISIKAITSTVNRLSQLAQWQEDLKLVPMPELTVKSLTFDAMAQGAFPPSKFSKFREALEEEQSRFGETLYSFHGAVTQTWKGSSLFQTSNRSRILNPLVDDYKQRFERGLPAPPKDTAQQALTI